MENNKNNTTKKEQDKKLDKFLGQEQECKGDECLIKNNGELVERLDKKFITPDGKQLLI
jgi:hypothetical protein